MPLVTITKPSPLTFFYKEFAYSSTGGCLVSSLCTKFFLEYPTKFPKRIQITQKFTKKNSPGLLIGTVTVTMWLAAGQLLSHDNAFIFYSLRKHRAIFCSSITTIGMPRYPGHVSLSMLQRHPVPSILVVDNPEPLCNFLEVNGLQPKGQHRT